MGKAMLVKSEQTLDFQMDLGDTFDLEVDSPKPIIFGAAEEPGSTEVRVTREFWEDMGRPQSLYVVYRPQ